jgi:hypothetical protein
MRRSGICALVLLLATQGICSGFDIEKYLWDSQHLNFVKDVNEVKTRMLSPQGRALYSAYSARPPYDKVGIYAHVHAPDLFSPLKTEVVKGMIEKKVAQELAKYGIQTINVASEALAGVGPDRAAEPGSEKIPILHLSTAIWKQPPEPGAAGENVHILSTRYDLYDWLWHRQTNCEIRVPLAGVALAPSIWYRARYDEERLVDYMKNHVRNFLQAQYRCCVEREAWTQLSHAGQLPDWLKPQTAKPGPAPSHPSSRFHESHSDDHENREAQ